MTTAEKWKAYWSDKSAPLHPSDSPGFYWAYAKELRVLFDERAPSRVLEIGCANGAMFEYLGFDRAQYKGVDFSPHLLAAFKSRHPGAELECREGSSYVDLQSRYDLIFSNTVVQYFDRAMLDSHFACARSMMENDSLFVCASIPWKMRRSNYDSGSLSGTMTPSAFTLAKAKIARVLRGDPMGYWYDFPEIAALGKRHGFWVKFYGSMVYLYRFHAAMGLK